MIIKPKWRTCHAVLLERIDGSSFVMKNSNKEVVKIPVHRATYQQWCTLQAYGNAQPTSVPMLLGLTKQVRQNIIRSMFATEVLPDKIAWKIEERKWLIGDFGFELHFKKLPYDAS